MLRLVQSRAVGEKSIGAFVRISFCSRCGMKGAGLEFLGERVRRNHVFIQRWRLKKTPSSLMKEIRG